MLLSCDLGEYIPFFQKSSFSFQSEIVDSSRQESPKIDIKMETHKFMVMELASAGFGSPEVLMNERVDLICDAYDYLIFKNKYEHQVYLIGTKK